jgi:hypothetical protein
MLVRFYRESHPSSFFTLPLIALLCWIPLLFFPPESFIVQVQNAMPLYEWLYTGISKLHIFAQYFISWLLVSIQAVYLNQLIVKHELFPKLTFLPALLFITLSVLFPEMMRIQPALFVNLLLLMVLDKVFMLYKNPEPLGKVFDASFILSLATLVDSSSIAFYFYLLLSFIILLPFNWRVWIISFIGFALPLYFLNVYLFLTDSLNGFWQKIPAAFRFVHFMPPSLKPVQVIAVSVLLLIFLISVLSISSHFYRNIIRIRRYFQMLFLLVLFAVLSLLLTPAVSLRSLCMMIIPFSIFFSYFFLQVKRKTLAEISFFLLVMFIILVRLV